MKRTPLRLKRPTPRRAAPERISHVRIKDKAATAPSGVEKAHMDRIVRLGCLVCGGRATIHHVTASINGGRVARSHKRTVPLCPAHHQIQWGKESVEALGHGGFFHVHGIDLWAEADRLWVDSERERGT